MASSSAAAWQRPLGSSRSSEQVRGRCLRRLSSRRSSSSSSNSKVLLGRPPFRPRQGRALRRAPAS
eukprot:4505308-Pyramimonas_sp.AAC.1